MSTQSQMQSVPIAPIAVNQSGGGAAVRLSLMMFLQYAAWGVWVPYLPNYLGKAVADGGLGFTAGEVGWILGLAASLGAVFAPLLAGQIADRFINAERWLGVLLLAGGAAIYSTWYARDYRTFAILLSLYSICFMPTLALTNSIAMAHLANPERSFPPVRLWGTIGWIVASNAFPLIWLQQQIEPTPLPPFLAGTARPDATQRLGDCLRVAGVMAAGYGLFAIFLLPKTPPRRDLRERVAVVEALGLLRQPSFAVLMLAAVPISMIHNVYFLRTGPFLEHLGFELAHVGPVMSIGQFSEIAFLSVLGLILTRLGYRWTLVVGALAYVARFGLFALAEQAFRSAMVDPETARGIAAAANILHGLCYGCFFATAFLYVERVAPPGIRHSAQTVFGVVILGVGPVLASVYNEYILTDALTGADGQPNYAGIWLVQAGIAAVVLLLVVAAFVPRRAAAAHGATS